MGLKLVTGVLFMLMALSTISAFKSRELLNAGVLDITSPKYGARQNTDIQQAILSAWRDACVSPSYVKVLVPKGTYQLKEARFAGPCKANVELQVDGTIRAYPNNQILTKKDTWVSFQYLNRFTLSGSGVFDGQGQQTWKTNDCYKNVNCGGMAVNLRFHAVRDSWINDITSINSKNFHLNFINCDRTTVQRLKIIAPDASKNTDGIHIGRTTGLNITNVNIGTGDDCISIGDGTKALTVTNVRCGPGHGIAIGSLGKYQNEDDVTGITIKNCTLTGTTHGLRIKTWPNSAGPSLCSNIHFEDVVMNNVADPIIIDQVYCPWNLCNKQSISQVKIQGVTYKNIRGTSSTPVAVKLLCAKGLNCDKVHMSDIDLRYNGKQGSLSSTCNNVRPAMSRVPNSLACATKA